MKKLTAQEKRVYTEKIWVTWTQIGYGIRLYLAFHPDNIGPIGMVWGFAASEIQFHVLYSFVLPYCRRKGVRTTINETIHKHHKVIHTWQGSKTGGEKFLKASGYEYNKTRDDWILVRKDKR